MMQQCVARSIAWCHIGQRLLTEENKYQLRGKVFHIQNPLSWPSGSEASLEDHIQRLQTQLEGNNVTLN